jgi:hypothetical protein
MSLMEPTIAWKPLAGSQTLALSCPCNEILYEGSRGPGKTDSQLIKFRRYVGLGYGRYWRGVIFDREYKNLDDLISKSQRWFPQFGGPKASFKSSTSDLKWVWDTGEELLFRQIKRTQDYWNYHGQEFPFIGWNELAKYPTPDLYEAMMSCNRSSFLPEESTPRRDPRDTKSRGPKDTGFATIDGSPLPDIPLMVFSTTNPYGPGHTWVKRKFIDPAQPGVVMKTTTEVFNPRTQKREPVTKTVVRLFGSYKENRFLSPEYVASLEAIRDENKRRAWLYGDWDIVAGGAFDDLWDARVHVVPRFRVPNSWRIDRSFDWGSSHPFSVGWWAEANGEEAVMQDGTTWAPPRGTLIRICEWYGSEEIGRNTGLKMSAKNIAVGIGEYEKTLLALGWIGSKPLAGPADNQIRNVTEEDVDTIEIKMAKEGILWEKSDKSPGSRINGLQLMRDRLEASLDNEGPGIYVMDNCRAFIGIIPTLPRDEDNPDDVDTEAEEHIWDDTRYRVLASSNRYATSIDVHTPR